MSLNLKPSLKEKFLRHCRLISVIEIIAWPLITLGVVIIWYFLSDVSNDGYTVFADTDVKYAITGQVGDFVGGVVGTIFTLGGTALIIFSFREQTKQNQRERFEATFFEMIKMHRDNVSEMNYTKYDPNTIYKNSNASEKRGDMWESKHKKVFRILIDEFRLCYQECSIFDRDHRNIPTIKESYRIILENLLLEKSIKVSVREIVIVDIAYSIFYYGLTSEGRELLEHSFSKKYEPEYYNALLEILIYKPKMEDEINWKKWLELVVYEKNLDDETTNILTKINYELLEFRSKSDVRFGKYYGGQQHRLGHYFRHIYQSFCYLYDQNWMEPKLIYFYGKMLRAQMSTYEQSLLFVNSLSSIGLKWELNSDFVKNSKEERKNLITSFGLIKNLPGLGIESILYKDFYPDVEFESDDIKIYQKAT